jgi:GntR family transcriptional regulator / MocR family aminotransferase
MMLHLDGTGPLYQQLCRAVREKIRTRGLAPGERVPSTRALASVLKISRNTAIMAYEQLLAEGYLEARIGAAGTVVASALPAGFRGPIPPQRSGPQRRGRSRAGIRLAAAGRRTLKAARSEAAGLGLPTLTWELTPPHIPFDFRPGRAAFPDVPYSLWCKLLGSRARRASIRDLDYGPPGGRWELREAIARRLHRLRGIDTGPERVVIVNGTQQALDLIARALLNPGDGVLIEEPHYTGARCALTSAGGDLIPAAVDEEGIRIPKAALRKPRVRLAYVTPSHQFPTGVALSQTRRLELLNWASRAGAFVIEDDYDSEFQYDGPPLQALAGLDQQERVIYVGTFSKILFPALRLAYLVLPQSLVEPIVTIKAVADTGTATLEQLTLADFIGHGHFDRHLRRTNAINAARRSALVAALRKEFSDRVEICGANAGLHLLAWLKGPDGGAIKEVSRKAQMAGVGLYPVDPFYLKPPASRTGVVLGYAPLREHEIREGIKRLATALA